MLTAAQLEARREVIGSSDIACILTSNGVSHSPWGGPRDVYWAKIGEIEQRPTPQTEGGTFLERAVMDWFEHRMACALANPDLKIERGVATLHPFCERMGCNLDGLLNLTEGEIPVEVKTVNPFAPNAHEWRAEGDGDIPVPFHYWLQLQHQMACTGAPYGFLVALMGTHDLREYRFEARPKLHARMIAESERFFEQYVIPRIEPPGIPPRAEVIERIPRSEGKRAEINGQLIVNFADAKRVCAEAKGVEDLARREILAALGDAELGESELGTVSYLANKNGARTLRFRLNEEVSGDAAAFDE